MFDFAGSNPKRERAKRAVGRGVGVTTHHSGSRLRQTQLRAHHVYDPLLHVTQGVQADAEFFSVLAQGFDLGAAGEVGDGFVDVNGRGVVVLRCDCEVGAAYFAACESQAFERLWAGDFVDEVEVNVDEVGFVVLTGCDNMVSPDLLRQRGSHGRSPSRHATCTCYVAPALTCDFRDSH